MNNNLANTLKAGIRLDTKQAVKQIEKLGNKLGDLERKLRKQANLNTNLTNKINNATSSTEKLNRAAGKVNNNFKKTNSTVSALSRNISRLASTYLGLMGAKAVLDTSDTITHAENKLNNITGDPTATQESMDKMYVSSNKVRMNYADMMSNVSKSMTLASGAFEDNIDNATRFQEIMSEAYTLGGASAAEQSSSMYQLIQALGSGTLQGDELRSVREGAPVAYKEIEKFAQGVYKTEESLKELASQGYITSEIVVAAIMNAGEQIDKQFQKTRMTFDQAFALIKNTAIMSFKPVLKSLNEGLNYLYKMGAFDRLAVVFQIIAGAIKIVVDSIIWMWGIWQKVFNFIAEHWDIISRIALTAIIWIATITAVVLFPKFVAWIAWLAWVAVYYIYVGVVAVGAAISAAISWMMLHPVLTLIILTLLIIITVLIWVAEGFVDACGIAVGSVYWVGAVIYNVIAFVINLMAALLSFVGSVTANIEIAFVNAWYGAKAAFWNFIADVLDGLKGLEEPINAVLKAFDKDPISISGVIDYARGKANEATSQTKSYVDVSDNVSKAFHALDYKNLGDAYDKGYGIGASGGQWMVDKLNAGKDWITDKLGMNNKLPSALDPAYSVADSYKTPSVDDLKGGVGDIADNTGKIKDSMDLTEEDLDYLRRIADMEWKKEFTTANITVDMSNYNTINNETDLDGIVTKLSEKLYEEMNAVADGVYV